MPAIGAAARRRLRRALVHVRRVQQDRAAGRQGERLARRRAVIRLRCRVLRAGAARPSSRPPGSCVERCSSNSLPVRVRAANDAFSVPLVLMTSRSPGSRMQGRLRNCVCATRSRSRADTISLTWSRARPRASAGSPASRSGGSTKSSLPSTPPALCPTTARPPARPGSRPVPTSRSRPRSRR